MGALGIRGAGVKLTLKSWAKQHNFETEIHSKSCFFRLVPPSTGKRRRGTEPPVNDRPIVSPAEVGTIDKSNPLYEPHARRIADLRSECERLLAGADPPAGLPAADMEAEWEQFPLEAMVDVAVPEQPDLGRGAAEQPASCHEHERTAAEQRANKRGAAGLPVSEPEPNPDHAAGDSPEPRVGGASALPPGVVLSFDVSQLEQHGFSAQQESDLHRLLSLLKLYGRAPDASRKTERQRQKSRRKEQRKRARAKEKASDSNDGSGGGEIGGGRGGSDSGDGGGGIGESGDNSDGGGESSSDDESKDSTTGSDGDGNGSGSPYSKRRHERRRRRRIPRKGKRKSSRMLEVRSLRGASLRVALIPTKYQKHASPRTSRWRTRT
jgi:hypothetical protein